jgi:nuclear transport factor 2 (NTF2) superfamily protein
MTREEALDKLNNPPYDLNKIEEEFEYVANKLGISVEELQSYHKMPLKWFRDYKNQEWLFDLGAKAMKLMGLERAIKR